MRTTVSLISWRTQAVAAVDSAMERELGYSAFFEAYPSDFGSRIIRTS